MIVSKEELDVKINNWAIKTIEESVDLSNILYYKSDRFSNAKIIFDNLREIAEKASKILKEVDVNKKEGSMSKKCVICNQDVSVRNPTGFCDHLRYPECLDQNKLLVLLKEKDEKIIGLLEALKALSYRVSADLSQGSSRRQKK